MTILNPSPAEPVSQLRKVKIVECGEEMVDFRALTSRIILDVPHFNYRRETVMRKSFAEKLARAANSLPEGFTLAVIEGWRPPYIQKRMYKTVWGIFSKDHPEWSESYLRRVVNRYTAPMNVKVPPPHTTGGAVDLALAKLDGTVLDHTGPFKRHDPACFAFEVAGLGEDARKHRQILADALLPQGITNYPSEYWHWSYGDQGWAYRGKLPNAIYGATEPPNWSPAPEDDVDEPLKFLSDRDS